jgi:hypothetical protein
MRPEGSPGIENTEQKLKRALLELGLTEESIKEHGVYPSVTTLSSDKFTRLMKPGEFFPAKEIEDLRMAVARSK